MELGSVANLASRLLAALEKTGVSSGAELRSDFGPSGQPDPELVRAFEEAMERGPEPVSPGLSGTDDATGLNEQPQIDVQPTEQTQFQTEAVPNGPQAMDAPEAPEKIADQSEGLRTAETNGFAPREAAATDAAPQPDVSSRVEASDGLRELENILGRIESGQLRAEDLFRMQYLAGMLKVHAESGMKASQKMAQGFESLLRQKG
jgi:hypothetical protein